MKQQPNNPLSTRCIEKDYESLQKYHPKDHQEIQKLVDTCNGRNNKRPRVTKAQFVHPNPH
jgi:hypothetical protein